MCLCIDEEESYVDFILFFADSIEAHVDITVVHVEDAKDELDKARNYQVLSFHEFFLVLHEFYMSINIIGMQYVQTVHCV